MSPFVMASDHTTMARAQEEQGDKTRTDGSTLLLVENNEQ
jgi:hypothetical protein